MWELNILWLLSPWLTNDDMERLITAAGLFAHHVAVVCHIAYPKAGNFVKDFNLFLDALSQPGKIKQIINIAIVSTGCLLCRHHDPGSAWYSPICTAPSLPYCAWS